MSFKEHDGYEPVGRGFPSSWEIRLRGFSESQPGKLGFSLIAKAQKTSAILGWKIIRHQKSLAMRNHALLAFDEVSERVAGDRFGSHGNFLPTDKPWSGRQPVAPRPTSSSPAAIDRDGAAKGRSSNAASPESAKAVYPSSSPTPAARSAMAPCPDTGSAAMQFVRRRRLLRGEGSAPECHRPHAVTSRRCRST